MTQFIKISVVPEQFLDYFRDNSPFPPDIVVNAKRELDYLAKVLQESYGVKVVRPTIVNWSDPETPGYTSSMVCPQPTLYLNSNLCEVGQRCALTSWKLDYRSSYGEFLKRWDYQ